MGNKEDLLKLLDRIACGEATGEEISEYNRWCDAFQEKGLSVSNIEEVKALMLKEIQNRIRHHSKTHRLKLWTKIAVAASVIGVMAFGGYRFLHKERPVQVAIKPLNDIAPGNNKAVLTLANGRSIILDSAQNGQLASQGNSKITKVGSSLLAYKLVPSPNRQHTTGNKQPTTASYNTLTVPRGGQYRLILPDGTKVWLNAASSIRYPTAFTGKERRVAITGEVYMEVAEDARHPFIVTTRSADITVLGTHFNIMAYDNEPAVKTTLLEGLVKVSVRGTPSAAVIKPGQQASVANTSSDIKVKKVNAADVAAWIHGLLSLKDCSVQEFMNQLCRWYNLDVDYEGPAPDKRFGGMINRNVPLSDVLSALDAAGIHTKLIKGKIIVLSH